VPGSELLLLLVCCWLLGSSGWQLESERRGAVAGSEDPQGSVCFVFSGEGRTAIWSTHSTRSTIHYLDRFSFSKTAVGHGCRRKQVVLL